MWRVEDPTFGVETGIKTATVTQNDTLNALNLETWNKYQISWIYPPNPRCQSPPGLLHFLQGILMNNHLWLLLGGGYTKQISTVSVRIYEIPPAQRHAGYWGQPVGDESWRVPGRAGPNIRGSWGTSWKETDETCNCRGYDFYAILLRVSNQLQSVGIFFLDDLALDYIYLWTWHFAEEKTPPNLYLPFQDQ